LEDLEDLLQNLETREKAIEEEDAELLRKEKFDLENQKKME
jgi:hypothetical protein